jgi:hypothetical protein
LSAATALRRSGKTPPGAEVQRQQPLERLTRRPALKCVGGRQERPSIPVPTRPADRNTSCAPPLPCPSIQIASPETPQSPLSFGCLGHPELPRYCPGITPGLLRYLRRVPPVSCSETKPSSSLSLSSCNRYPQNPYPVQSLWPVTAHPSLITFQSLPASAAKLPAIIGGRPSSVNSAVPDLTSIRAVSPTGGICQASPPPILKGLCHPAQRTAAGQRSTGPALGSVKPGVQGSKFKVTVCPASPPSSIIFG